jgi:HlyD family secretion protein
MQASGAAPGSAPRRRPIALITVVALAVVVAGWEGWRWYERQATAGRLFASGSIEATQVDVNPKVAGRVTKLLAKEGDSVRAGQVLAELEPQESQAQVDQARAAVAAAQARVVQAAQAVTTQQQVTGAQVAQAEAQIASAETRVPQSQLSVVLQDRTVRESIAAAQAQLSAAQAQLAAAHSAAAKARADLRRTKELFAQGAVAAEQVDAAQTAYDAAVAQERSAADAVTQARAGLATARANQMQVAIKQQDVQAAQQAVAEARAALKNAQSGYTLIAQRQQDLSAAQAALAQAQATLRLAVVVAAHNTVVAPVDGVVLTKNIEKGEVVAAGTAIYTLVTPDDIWLRVFIPEDQIGRVRLGQSARITVDTFPGRGFEGRVSEISPQAEFTPGNVQTKEDRVKLVFGVKIRLDNRDGSLKPGMPADAEILVGPPAEQAGR